ncbi:treacle protein isoform X1 [Cydia pomonella]|uniref:treacle protein isoform X1 n=1 Tax=Cydia pomonella TaxID=82600 RepID=UPI002ADE1B57|nr:treacle protein isoform X1 [Cydia pomonella]
MRFIPLVILVACVVCEVSARARPQDEGEARAAPSRGLLKRGLLAKGKPTSTTTTTPAPQEEAEYEDEEYVEGEQQEPSTEAPPSSTEGKKLVAGGVRPFRSNTDLLAALKRRRAQAAEAKLNGGQSTAAAAPAQDSATEAPVKANFNKKRFNTATRETNSEDAPPAPAKPVRGRFGKPAARSIQEAEEEQAEPAPVRSGRTFSRRGGN